MATAVDEPDSSSAAVTVATPPPPAAVHPSNDSNDNNPAGRVLTLALPIQQPRPPSKSPSPAPAPAARVGPPVREDCWSEGATSVLIDAWGERYLHLNRGNLRRSDWQEVADAVSSREDYTKPTKSDAQCKNRIDTLKKKYKQEISKRSSSGSNWIFFDRLHHLVGGNPNPPAPPRPSSNRIRLPAKRPPQPQTKSPSPPPSEDESSEGFPPPPPPAPTASAVQQQRKRGRDGEIGEIMRAVMRFAEIYEKAEKEKMVAEAEVEKRRLEFEKEIEVQRVQFFLRAQMEIDRIVSGGRGGRGRDRGRRQWGRRLAGGGRGNTGTSNIGNNVMSDDSSQ